MYYLITLFSLHSNVMSIVYSDNRSTFSTARKSMRFFVIESLNNICYYFHIVIDIDYLY